MEDKKFKVNWYDVLSKIVFLIIIILILMWFFPRGTNNNNDGINGKLDSIQSNLSVLLDKVFRDNLNEMKAAAKAYFTKDRMPTEDGESISLTLQEMYDKNMLLPLMDKDGKACSAEKSYVKVTKDGDKYKLKISLTCGNETKSITETIGCYDFCEDDSCGEKGSIATKLQYQFVREVESTKYSCPSGYSLKGRYCYSSKFGDRIAAEEIWEDEKTITKDADKVEGGEVKVCEDATKTQDDPTYTCPEGYTLDGTKCTKTETVPATRGYKYTCPSGYTKNNNYCYKKTTKSATANYKYGCKSGYTLKGTKCKKTTTKTKSATRYVKSSKKVFTGYGSWRYIRTYTCESSRCSSNGLYQYTGQTKKMDYIGSYYGYSCDRPITCPNKIRYKQYKYYTRSANYKTVKTYAYKCTGSGWTRKNKTCSKKVTTTKSATKTIKSYSCPSGYTKNNKTCTKSSVIPATKVDGELSCPDGYALKGETCYKTVETPATEHPGEIHYSCPDEFTLEGKKCCKTIKTDDKYYCSDPDAVLEGHKCIITIPAHIVGYKCPKGYIKDGKTCYTKVTKKKRAISRTVVSYQYKWSSFKSLYGWTRTGKTRSV